MAFAEAPEQLMLYVVVCDGVTVTEPEVPEAVKPVPVQELALAELQVRVVLCPLMSDVGEADSVAVA